MCGGVAFNFRNIPEEKMQKYFSKEELEAFKKVGQAQSYYWSKTPVLPYEKDGKIDLVDWGNRSDDDKLPKTGWAKTESIDEGKWAYLKPEFVKIPVDKGYEKGKWFKVSENGFKGALIEKNNKKHLYMVTKLANKKYLEDYKHDRQPVEL